uniref:Uncharacterized protein n=1 Tax=Lactuca sativa TaxID=4236 RepID=A0A9R1XH56_LACSA|nr:hypothetical protein LSAT_V11C500257830 [Lactuca sativa]
MFLMLMKLHPIDLGFIIHQSLCLHIDPKPKRREKKKVDTKSTTPVPPPTFAVDHDFSVLRLQPYVAGGEVVLLFFFMHITSNTDSTI